MDSVQAALSKPRKGGISTYVGVALLVVGLIVGAGSTYLATTVASHGSSTTSSTLAEPSPGSLTVSEGGMSSANATTSDYRVMLVLGPEANMTTCVTTTGSSSMSQNMTTSQSSSGMGMSSGGTECMLEGQMSSMMMATADVFHLEVHLYDLSSGAALVLPSGQVSITVSNSSMTTSVPIAVMYDPTVGLQDMHYGNNVALGPGTYTVTVTADGEQATFAVHVVMTTGSSSSMTSVMGSTSTSMAGST